jgi:glycosyltransferase involved in cell wall biosynthesis
LRLALRTADYVTAVSGSLLEWGETITSYKASSPVYNSIEPGFVPKGWPTIPELRDRLGLCPDATVLGSNAVFVWKKGPEYLESLLRCLGKSDLSNLEFVLIGKYREELRSTLGRSMESQSSEGKLRRVVAVPLPSRRDLPYLLAALDLFVLTSRREGMPNVLLEAMACGTPVAATAVNGCVDLLKDPEAGLLLDPFDPDNGAQQILRLLADPDRLRHYAELGKELVEKKYSVEQELSQLKKIYRYVQQNKQNNAGCFSVDDRGQ